MNFNAARLIKMIKERPCIYDAQSTKMSKHQRECLKEKKIAEIATALNLTAQLVKVKWKNLRDTYIKYLKWDMKHPNKTKRWKWAKQMSFMKRHLLSIQPQQENGQDVQETIKEEQDNHSEYGEPQFNNVEFLEISGEETSVSGEENDDQSPAPKKRRRSSFVGIEEVSIPSSRAPYDYLESNQSYDALELIFLGYAKTIKSFSTKRQAQVKMKIAKLIIDEELAQFQENVKRD